MRIEADGPVNFVCMEQQGPWMANYIDHLRPDLQRLLWPRDVEMTKPIAERRKNYFWAVAPFPDVDGFGDVTYASCDVLCIPRGAVHYFVNTDRNPAVAMAVYAPAYDGKDTYAVSLQNP